MTNHYHVWLYALLFTVFSGCMGQAQKQLNTITQSLSNNNKLVGGGCDGCEIMFVGIPQNINAVDTSAGWKEKGQKLLVTGVVFKPDGKTPAEDVIIYYWQTDNNGYYSPIEEMDEPAKKHGYIRGWVKTDKKGNYSIYTTRPAPYPGTDIPAHIHISIKEPTINNEYYIDEFVFNDDTLLTSAKRKALKNRGGSGILKTFTSGDVQIAEHNIIAGLNIPNYPNPITIRKK
jgi:protocatechuate 3,4-dioxygenase beta subunit